MTEASQENVICPACGELTLRDANFCEICGSEIDSSDTSALASSVLLDTAKDDQSVSKTVVIRTADRSANGTGAPLNHRVAFKTDIGYKHHVNQDAGGAWTRRRPDGTPVSLIAVADGVSAGRNSEGASKLTVDIILERLGPLLDDPAHDMESLLDLLLETARTASHKVAQRPHHAISSADATTLVAALCIGSEGGGVWCGDSRVYQLVPHGVVRLTTDHSWAEGVVSQGIMSAEDAAKHPHARMITRWLGPPDQDDPGVESFRFRADPGDVVLCCTDGLYMYFSPPASEENEMVALLQSSNGDLQVWTERLIETALQRGGRDNVTAAAIAVDGQLSDGPEEPTTEIPSIPKVATNESV